MFLHTCLLGNFKEEIKPDKISEDIFLNSHTNRSTNRRLNNRLEGCAHLGGGAGGGGAKFLTRAWIGCEKTADHVFCLFLVIQALVALVQDPEPEHPLRADLAEEYTKDRKKFMKNAEEHTKKHAEKRPSD